VARDQWPFWLGEFAIHHVQICPAYRARADLE
jgi:hypothetical protein